MSVLVTALLTIGAGVRTGLPAADITTPVGNGLIFGGVLSIVIGLVFHAPTMHRLLGRHIAAVNLAYAGRMLDGDDLCRP